MLEYYWICIGQVTAFLIFVKFALLAWDNYSTYFQPNPFDFSKCGKWSVVTGATDGIGKAIAFELARKGQNIALISRNSTKLEKVAKEIETEHKVETKCLAVDFTELSIYSRIKSFLGEIKDIGILINNVGISSPPGPFLDAMKGNKKIINDILNVNVVSVFRMMEIMLPVMLAKGRGVIMNMSSLSAENPIPHLSLYGATKVCIDYFTKSLQIDYRKKGVIIQTVRPGFVSTNLTMNGKAKPLYPSAKTYARSLMKTIGKQDDTNGYFGHTITSSIMAYTPGFILNFALVKRMEAMKKGK